MSSIIAAYSLSIISLGAASLLCALVFGFKFVFRLALYWSFFLTIAFFTNIFVLILSVLVFAFFLRNESYEAKVIYFIALMPVLPLQPYIIPFPGLNYLWDLSFLRLLTLCLFLPLFLQGLFKPGIEKNTLRATDFYFLGYILFISLLSYRDGSLTETLRKLFSNTVDYVIPYYVISRYVRNPITLHWLLCALLFTAAILSFASVAESWQRWRFFTELFYILGLDFSPLDLVPLFRVDKYRTSGGTMLNQLAFAHFIAVSCIVAFYLLKSKLSRFVPVLLLLAVCCIGLVLTDAKSGFLTLLCGIFTLFYMKLNPFLRVVVGFVILLFMVPLFWYLFSTGFSSLEDSGESFAYRYQLILNSLDAISKNPLFGSIDFLENPVLQQSRQGQGIIDVVNIYLQVLLEYGFVGLFLYTMIFFSLIWGVIRKARVAEHDHRDIIVALLVATMLFIFTSSDVSFTPFYIMLIWAMARAFMDFPVVHQKLVSRQSSV